jgi:hypothetical protein
MAVFTALGAAAATAIGLAEGSAAFIAVSGITAAALQITTGIAVSLIGKSLAGDDTSKNSETGVRTSLTTGSDVPRSIMLGYGATAGSLVYANEWGTVDGTPNAYFTQVICLADYPVNGLAQVWVDDQLATLGDTPVAQGYPVLEYRKDGVDYLWVKFYDGTQVAADTFLTGTVSSAARPYGATRVGTGCAYAIVTSLVEESLFSGFPRLVFALNGAKLYDITKDTTAGGSGSQRWNTPSTWGGDGDNLPVVQVYNLLRGVTINGTWLYGLQGLAAARLPNAAWISEINKCRALIAGASGDEATYRSGGEVAVSTTIATAIEGLLTACQGRLAEIGGIYKPHVGAPSESPVLTFNDGDILSTEGQSFTPFYGLADTINGVSAKYPSPAEGWNTKVAPPLLRADFEVLDGNRRLMADVSLDFVPYDGQVQRLMKSALEESRRARRHTFVLPPEAFVLEPNDIIEWTSTRNGYATKLFRVDGISDRANLDVMVDITEVDPADYDWDQGSDYTPVVLGPIAIVRPVPQVLPGWAVAPYTFPDSDALGRRFGIQASYAGGLHDIRSIRIQVRENFGSGNTIYDSGAQPYDVSNPTPISIIAGGFLLPATDYEVRGILIPESGRDAVWSDWLGVTTPDIRFDLVDLSNSLKAFKSWMDCAFATSTR